MSLTVEQVEYIAELARLHLNPREKESFSIQLSAILDYAARLQKVDTTGIPPTSSVLPERTRLRDDEPRVGLSHPELFSNAPEVDKKQFRVPLILE